MGFHFAIIGAGLTGTAMIVQLFEILKKHTDATWLTESEFKISIFEREPDFGPGFPHSPKNVMPFHITNMCAEEMSIHPENPYHFQDWVTKNRPTLECRFPDLLGYEYAWGKCSHYPRTIFGEYLKETFQNTISELRKIGVAITASSQTEVLDIKVKTDKLRLTVKYLPSGEIKKVTADRAILATGHWHHRDEKSQHLLSPWPAKKLDQIVPKKATVAIIGSSLSAIEVLLTLTAGSRFIQSKSGGFEFEPVLPNRRFVLYSRRGLLPKVRGKTGAYQNQFLTATRFNQLRYEKGEKLSLFDIFSLLNADLENAYVRKMDWQRILKPSDEFTKNLEKYLKDAINGDGADGEIIWQTVLYQFFDHIRDAYLSLPNKARYDFEKHYTSLFFTHAATQPIVNAQKLLALLKTGLVSVKKLGHDYHLEWNKKDGCWIFDYKNQFGDRVVTIYKYVVDARGQTKRIDKDPSPLTQNLIRRQLIMNQHVGKYNTGSVWIDPGTHHPMKKSASNKPIPNKRLYAVGAMTRGQIINASMARGIVASTARVATDIAKSIIGRL